MKPYKPGWYWFLPDPGCQTLGIMTRLDKPIVLLIGQGKYTRDGKPPKLRIRSPKIDLTVDQLIGDWQAIKAPMRMQVKATERIQQKHSRKQLK